jgi:nucleoside-diphosphate-sugar epimerase
MRTLVTGGGGFIGAHLVDRLLDDGHEVVILDNFATGRRENVVHFADRVTLVEGDIQSYERAHKAVKGTEVVFHLAALPSVPRSVQDPLTTNASNVIGTLNLLSAARDEGVRRFVFSCSSSVYGANPTMPKHEQLALMPISPYAVSKLAAEGYCRAYHEVYGLETVSLRYFNIFGPRQDPMSQYAAVIPRFILAILSNRRPVIYGDGEQTRDFTYVANAIEANILAAAADGIAGKAFNVACGERISLNRVLANLAELAGTEVEADYRPPRAGDIKHSLADISAARSQLGYTSPVSFEDGLERTFEHYRSLGERARNDLLSPL